jgi:hypothetical protein
MDREIFPVAVEMSFDFGRLVVHAASAGRIARRGRLE